MNLTFVETAVFTARWQKRQDDQMLRRLQSGLLENPDAGHPIPGCGLLRKLRFADASRGKGKRGGLRVVYMHTPESLRVDLITVYGKDEKDDMSKDELASLCKLAKALRGHNLRETYRNQEAIERKK